jgi:RND family efflux transporter MFP subunit
VAKRPQLQEARAAVQAAKARLATARLNLERTRLSLPFKGRVAESSLEAGQFVTAGQSYGRAYSLEAVEVAVPLEDRQVGWIREAKDPALTVHADYLGEPRKHSAFVKRFDAEADPRTRFTKAYLGLKEPSPELIPGMFVSVEVIGALKRDAWVLPLSALQAKDTAWAVDNRGRLRRLPLEILQVTRRSLVAAGDGTEIEVVTSPLPQVTESTKVRVLDDASSN